MDDLPFPILRTGKALAGPLEGKAIVYGLITDHQVAAAALASLGADAFAATYDTETIQYGAHQSAGIYGRHTTISHEKPIKEDTYMVLQLKGWIYENAESVFNKGASEYGAVRRLV